MLGSLVNLVTNDLIPKLMAQTCSGQAARKLTLTTALERIALWRTQLYGAIGLWPLLLAC